jgi:hypothetical protein
MNHGCPRSGFSDLGFHKSSVPHPFAFFLANGWETKNSGYSTCAGAPGPAFGTWDSQILGAPPSRVPPVPRLWGPGFGKPQISTGHRDPPTREPAIPVKACPERSRRAGANLPHLTKAPCPIHFAHFAKWVGNDTPNCAQVPSAWTASPPLPGTLEFNER